MTALFNLNYPLQSLCWPKQNKLLKNGLLVLTGVLVLAIASQLTIPFHPVPLTFQSATVLLIALVYGARLGAATIAAYLIAGACGLPVFAEMYSGLPVLLGLTGGFLCGFFFAALLTGYLAQRGWGKHFISAFAAALLGAVVIFVMGLLVLSHYVGGWKQAYTFGLQPFLISEPIKLLAVAAMAPRFWKKTTTHGN